MTVSVLSGLALAVFLAGLLGGAHCAGICGGLLSALSASRGPNPWRRLAALHAGRIASYALLGAGAGALGAASAMSGRLIPVQTGLYVSANVLLMAVGIHHLGWRAPLTHVERRGSLAWSRLGPISGRFLPADTPGWALMTGSLWGLMPCGLVYGALALALLTGSALGGMVAMAAFGLGTLPNLLAVALVLKRMAQSAWRHLWQRVLGLVILAFGLYGLVHATWLSGPLQNGVLCVAR